MKNIYNELRRHTDIVESLQYSRATNNINTIDLLDSRFTVINQAGHSTTVQSTLSDINDSGNPNWLMPATATTLEFVSTDAQDGSGGTGITLILVQGLDQNLDSIQEVIAMNGLTIVTTLLSYRAMNAAIAIGGGTAGSGCVGEITISATSDSQVFGKFIINDTQSEVGRYTVPNGYRGLLFGSIFNGGSGADMTVNVEITVLNAFPVTGGTIFVSGFMQVVAFTHAFMEAGTTFKWRGFTNSGSPSTRKLMCSVVLQLGKIQDWDSLLIN